MHSNATANRIARKKAIKEGRCTRCRSNAAAPARTTCDPCRAYIAAWVQAKRANAKPA